MKKGFTLIELLGVLILLAVIALITFPIIDKVLTNSKEEAYQRQKDNIIEAARIYVTTNGNYNTNQAQLSFQTLIDAGVLKYGEILDPRDSSKEMPGCVLYNWNESKNQYIFEYDEECIATTPVECFTYQSYETGVEITNYDEICGGYDVFIPNIIDGKKVLSISDYAFSSKKLTSVKFSDNLVSIGKKSFSGNGLTKLDLSNLANIKTISYDAFACNSSITSSNFTGIGSFVYSYFNFSCY